MEIRSAPPDTKWVSRAHLRRCCYAGLVPAEALDTRDRETLVYDLWAAGWTDVEIATHTRLTTYTTGRIRARLRTRGAPTKGGSLMPIRFQVDPDFYDHPKTTGMSDAAFSLWVRAGSYSAAKTTDGFVNEDVLVYTLRSNVEVAEELVGRGLWRRRKGGFQFHQWDARNLTRERVEADRTSDRDRKRRERAEKKPKGSWSDGPDRDRKRRERAEKKPKGSWSDGPVDNLRDSDGTSSEGESHEVDTDFVRPDTDRTPDGFPPESQRNPHVSVSVSVSESVSESVSGSVSVSGQARPPVRCPRHLDDPSPPNCGHCAEARRTAETFDRDQTRAAADRRNREVRQRDDNRRRAIANCVLCDPDGYAGRQLCTHDPGAADRAVRGRAAVQAALHGNREDP